MYDLLFKLIIVGDTGIGKSCMILRFVDGKFTALHDMTIGVEFGSKTINIDDKKIKLQLWDTAGQEQFRSITRSYYKNCSGVVLCYDSTNRISFNNVTKWLAEINHECRYNPQIILVATKCDLVNRREVKYDEGKKFADENGMLFIETSAKDSSQVEKCFTDLAATIYSRFLEMQKTTNFSTAEIEYQGIKIGNSLYSPSNAIVVDNNKQSSSRCCK